MDTVKERFKEFVKRKGISIREESIDKMFNNRD